MASRLLTKHVAYLPNLRSAVKHVRAFAWYRNDEQYNDFKIVERHTDSLTVWPDEKLGPFGPKDKRFPLPGCVGTSLTSTTLTDTKPQTTQVVDPEQLFDQLPSARYGNILRQVEDEADLVLSQADDETSSNENVPTADDMLEFVAHECPQIMRKDFADLFPLMDIMHGHFTVITISHKTKEDMTGWSMEVEAEREQLLESFIQGATDICLELQKAGYWADFIDPSSGKPYLGEHTNSTLYETDERYRKLGFEIDDLGCCKVIRHHLWGTNSYIGCLFTNAPTQHPIVNLMKKS